MRRVSSQFGAITMCLTLLFSCGAKKAAQQLTASVPENYSGKIRIDACDPKGQDDNIAISEAGGGTTSICSVTDDFKLLIARGPQKIQVAATVNKTGDNILTSVVAEIPATSPAHLSEAGAKSSRQN